MSELDYNAIPAPGHKCAVCGRDLALVNKHPSVLEVNKGGLAAERRDVCPECWEKQAADHEFYSFWVTQREAPKPDMKLERAERNRRLLALFEAMRTATDPKRYRAHLYVLAHTLMKYRLFKWEGTRKGEAGESWLLFRDVSTEELIEIEDVNPNDDGLIGVMRGIERVLAGESPRSVLEGSGVSDQHSTDDAGESPAGGGERG